MLACALLLIAPAGSAASGTTIGQLAPGSPAAAICGFQDTDILQTTITSGAAYLVPPYGARIVSWSTNASIESNQLYTLKIFRRLGPTTFQVVAHDGPRPLIPGALNTFAVDLPAQPGDIIGLNFHQGLASSACEFTATSADIEHERTGSLGDGEQASDFSENNDFRVNVSAIVKPSNALTLGKAKYNTKRGTATVSATVPGPGELSVSGKGVARSASASVAVSAPGTVKLRVRPRGKARRTLRLAGRATVRPKITFTPTNGDPNTASKKVKLRQRA